MTTDRHEDQLLFRVHRALLFLGTIALDTARRTTAPFLQEGAGGELEFERIVDRGVIAGKFDRPRLGQVRALLADPHDYQDADWRRCLLEVVGTERIQKGEALRASAMWANERLGLRFAGLTPGGEILRSLELALDRLIADGTVAPYGDGCVGRALDDGKRSRPRSRKADQRRAQELRLWLAVAIAGVDSLMHAQEEALIVEHAGRHGLDGGSARRLIDRYRATDSHVIPSCARSPRCRRSILL